MLSNERIEQVLKEFAFEGELASFSYPYGEGHINDTVRVETRSGSGKTTRYIVQKINRKVFKKPAEVMANIAAVTSFLHEKIVQAGGDPARETLSIIATRSGGLYYLDEASEYWRAYLFIENTKTLQQAQTPVELRAAARAFAGFLLQLSDFPLQGLYESIPEFHNCKLRLTRFTELLKEDPRARAAGCRAESALILARAADCSVLTELLEAGQLPLRVTHNDTKLNNVLLDRENGRGVCILDLDTVMPGLAAYDFGDAICSAASTAAEDEADLQKVRFDLKRYRIYTKAYLSAAAPILTANEIESLPRGARIITLETAIRFLTDYLEGDVYFKTQYPEHNLVRARNQLKLLLEMEAVWAEMQAAVQF